MDNLSNILISKFELLNENDIVFSLFKNVFIIGFGTFLSLLPLISVYYFFIAILEESLYLKKVLYIFEKPLNKIGLSSNNVLPLLNSFGCCVSALQSLNEVKNLRERKISALAISFLTCSGKIPLCIALSMVYFHKFQWIIALGFYMLGIGISCLLILLATPRIKIVEIKELPIVKIPNFKIVLTLVINKIKNLITKVYPIFFVCAILIWLLFSFDFKFNYVEDPINSILGFIGRILTSLFYKLEIYDWRVYTSFFSGFFFKENLESTLSLLAYGVENFNCLFSRITIYVFATFAFVSTPCICVISELKRQFGYKFATFTVFFQYFIAWLLASAFFSFGMLIWKLYFIKAHKLFRIV
jgi:ferrous iron transport protein B